ncbi:unnamed protein product [Rhizophagus irregularis]|nr:unnamed protein product [Rhizophagus irregularis]
MSNMGDSVGTLPEEDFLKFISAEGESFLYYTTFQLGQFVENGFLKNLFDKNPPTPVDKAQLLVDMFGKSANPNNFAQQAAATNIQPTTLSLIFSIALYASSRSWDYFATRAYTKFGDMGDSESECPSAKDEFGSTFLSTPKSTPKTKDKQKARVTDDKHVIHQSFTAKPEAQTSDKQALFLGAKTTAPGVTHILTGYKEVEDERAQVRDIIVYDIPYTWDVEKILGELTLWGKTIKLSLKRQHKYQTLRVKIVLNPFTLPQFDKFWTTDLGGIPVRWFPASWTLRERKQREKFQAVIHDIPEGLTMATLWQDRKPSMFLTTCGASAFKIIQTSKGKRKLVGYFENWEATLKALGTLQKAPNKPKAKNVTDKKSGQSGQQSVNVNLKKKGPQPSTSAKKQAKSTKDSLKDPKSQKSKSNKKSRDKGGSKVDNKEVLAEILSLLRKLV